MHSIIMSPGLAGNYPAAGARLALLARCCLHLRLCADSKALLWEGVQGHLQQQFSTGKGLAQGLLSSLTCWKVSTGSAPAQSRGEFGPYPRGGWDCTGRTSDLLGSVVAHLWSKPDLHYWVTQKGLSFSAGHPTAHISLLLFLPSSTFCRTVKASKRVDSVLLSLFSGVLRVHFAFA